jgi:fluoroacetyl-CoA thioesterase
MKPVPVGTKGSFQQVVEKRHLASELNPALAQVMSTPTMLGMMELAAIEAITPFLEPGEGSVGTSIEAQHTAVTPPGHRVRAQAEVTKCEGRRLEFAVTAFDENEQIGEGHHRRAIIDTAKFDERIKAKVKL